MNFQFVEDPDISNKYACQILKIMIVMMKMIGITIIRMRIMIMTLNTLFKF